MSFGPELDRAGEQLRGRFDERRGSSAFGESRWRRWFAERAVLKADQTPAPLSAASRIPATCSLEASARPLQARRVAYAGVIERVDDQVLLALGAQALLGLCRRGDLINCTSSGGVQTRACAFGSVIRWLRSAS